jgi:hypothetical protein
VPDLAFFMREILPGEADDLGKGGMVGLDLRGDVLVLDEGGAEENEGVGRSWDVVLWFLLTMALTLDERRKWRKLTVVCWRGEQGRL